MLVSTAQQLFSYTYIHILLGFPGDSDGKESASNVGDLAFDPCVRIIPWRREWLPTPVFLPGEFHGQRSLAGCSPWGCKESDTTERLTLSLSCIFLHVLFHMVYHRILTAVPCVHSRTMLFIHLYMDASANPKLRLHPSPSLHPLGNHKYVLYVCESKTAFCFANFMFVFYFDLASVWVKR